MYIIWLVLFLKCSSSLYIYHLEFISVCVELYLCEWVCGKSNLQLWRLPLRPVTYFKSDLSLSLCFAMDSWKGGVCKPVPALVSPAWLHFQDFGWNHNPGVSWLARAAIQNVRESWHLPWCSLPPSNWM